MRNKMSIGIIVGVVLMALILVPQFAQAQEGQIRLGTQYNYPFGGLSIIYDLDDTFAVQGIVGGGFAGKIIFRAIREPMWNVYGFGGAGYRWWGPHTSRVFAGAGYEFDLRHFGIDLGQAVGRPDWVFKPNIELGATFLGPQPFWFHIGSGFHVTF